MRSIFVSPPGVRCPIYGCSAAVRPGDLCPYHTGRKIARYALADRGADKPRTGRAMTAAAAALHAHADAIRGADKP